MNRQNLMTLKGEINIPNLNPKDAHIFASLGLPEELVPARTTGGEVLAGDGAPTDQLFVDGTPSAAIASLSPLRGGEHGAANADRFHGEEVVGGCGMAAGTAGNGEPGPVGRTAAAFLNLLVVRVTTL
jgi:hypothetical protein